MKSFNKFIIENKSSKGPLYITQKKFDDAPTNPKSWKNPKSKERNSFLDNFRDEGDISNDLHYFGEIVDGLPNGKGTLIFPVETYDAKNNEIVEYDLELGGYSGEFKNGQYNGKGKLIFPDGEAVYNGEWKNGKLEGQGTYFGKHNY